MNILSFIIPCIITIFIEIACQGLVTRERLVKLVEVRLPTQGDFPLSIRLHISWNEFTSGEFFDIKRSNVNPNAPSFKICDRGKSICAISDATVQIPVYFQDVAHQAVFSVIKTTSLNNPHNIWSGYFMLNGTVYDLDHVNDPAIQSNLYKLTPSEDIASPSDYISTNPNEVPQKESRRNPQQRHKRQQNSDLWVELLIVVDNVIFMKWYHKSKLNGDAEKKQDATNNLKRYFAHVVNGMDLRYQTIKGQTYQIHIILAGYIFAQLDPAYPDGFIHENFVRINEFPDYWINNWSLLRPNEVSINQFQGDIDLPTIATSTSRKSADADLLLDTFRDWVKQTSGLPPHDHIMLFTGHDLFSEKRGLKIMSVTGLAYLGQICTGSSVSIVEYHGGFSSALIASHELGHSLGAKHDGDGNRCLSMDQFIMTSQAQSIEDPVKMTHSWTFSRCSLEYFSKMFYILKDRNRDCLFNRKSTFSQNEIKGYLREQAGQWFSVDQLCQQHLGSASYMCRDLLMHDEEICTSLWCHRPNSNKCRQHIPPRGTSCGNKKWCINGLCVHDRNAPSKVDGCVHGNVHGVLRDNKTCAQFVAADPAFCYERFIERRCCEECRKHYIPISGCEYGDRQTNCDKSWCTTVVRDRETMLKQCCRTCKFGKPITTTTLMSSVSLLHTTTVSNTPCRDIDTDCLLKAKLSPQKCYTLQFVQICCQACQMISTNNSECNYGDRDEALCHNMTRSSCMSEEMRQICCETCSILTLISMAFSHCYSKHCFVITLMVYIMHKCYYSNFL